MTYRLVSWGANSHGQLGQVARSEECTEPREADLSGCGLDPARIRKVAGGAGHTLILDDGGRLYSCGWNNRGQAAFPEKGDALLLREVGGPLKDKYVADVACGWDTSMALTEDGSVYLWGSNAYGQLGVDPSIVRWTSEPFWAKINEKIKHVSMGLRHTVLVSQSGKVFASGSNGKGQLGLSLSDSKGVHSFAEVPGISDAEDVACGQHHTIVTTTNKDLYAFGDNKHGQLGLDPGKVVRAASPIKLTTGLSFEVAIEPHAGWSHTVLLAGDELFTWGRNCYGQLGAPGTRRLAPWRMERVEGVGNVRQIATGSEHSVALTEDGSVLCWGWNEHGNCGNGTNLDLHSPERISLAFNYTATVVGAGAGHSLADRITGVEKHFAELCTSFAAYTRKSARLRDKGDEVAKVVQSYAQSENINRSLSTGLANFSTILSVIGDYRDAEVQRLDNKVVASLSQYDAICKHARDDVKNTFAARDRELTRRRHLDRLRERNPRNTQMISQAESELMKASVEVSRVIKGLEEQIDSFEKRKLHDLKTVILDFILIELSFHTKAIELLTKAYQDVAEIDEAKDLEEFRETMHVPDSVARLETVGRTSFRQAYSLTNLASRFSSSPMISQRLANRTTESLDSAKTGSKTNSSESVQIEEYGDSSEETESESDQDRPTAGSGAVSRNRGRRRFALRVVPPILTSRRSLKSPLIVTHA